MNLNCYKVKELQNYVKVEAYSYYPYICYEKFRLNNVIFGLAKVL